MLHHDGKLGQRLKAYRKKYDLYQWEVAAFLGVSRSTYAYYESGKIEPRFGFCLKLCILYSISMQDLTGIPPKKGGK